jgi:formate transporter FocA
MKELPPTPMPAGQFIHEERADIPVSLDAFPPNKIAERAEDVGVSKAKLDFWTLLTLAVLAGAFIALGAVFSTTVTAGADGRVYFGMVRLLGGLTFCLGLILVVVAGAELFTGNNLIIMAFVSGKVSLFQLLRNWGIVYLGNFIGSIATAGIMLVCSRYKFGHGVIWLNALNIADAKCSKDFIDLLALGTMCNALVCLAVWLCWGARSTTDKILAIVFPITAFVAAGFEHSVANMYFIPAGILAKTFAPPEFWILIGKTAADFSNLTWHNFFWVNLIPVTLGNIIGGSFLVGLVYWFAYRRTRGLHLQLFFDPHEKP